MENHIFAAGGHIIGIRFNIITIIQQFLALQRHYKKVMLLLELISGE